MDSALVIKVICGDSVRRFTTNVDENGNLDLNMDGLRARIVSLFKLNSDADLTLTYIDEDNDVVTLVDEDDFHDAILQPLNPLKISVNNFHDAILQPLNPLKISVNNLTETSNTGFGQIQELPSDIKASRAEVLEFVCARDHLRDALVKLDHILMSIAKISVPAFTELVEVLPELALSHLDTIFHRQNNASSNAQSCTSNIHSKRKQGLETSKDTTSTVLSSDEFRAFNPESINKGVGNSSRKTNASCKNRIPNITRNSSATHHACPTNVQFGICDPSHVQLGICGPDVLLPEGNYVSEVSSISNGNGSIDRITSQCNICRACPTIEPQSKLKYDHNQIVQSFDCLNQSQTKHQNSLPIHVARDSGMKPCIRKLDSLSIQEVEVMDEDRMKPATPFTKIWRMRNNGEIVWPQGTQLIWIGGDQFTNKIAVEIQLPVDGLHVNNELDIGVDFTAPEQPGRYTSYWRMALPSGYKFGEIVWVHIQVQVETSPKDSSTDRFYGLKLISFPNSSKAKCKEIVDEKGSFDVDEVAYEYMNQQDRKKGTQRKLKYGRG